MTRIQQLLNNRSTQPYDIVMDGLKITVEKDVFPPDMGYTSRYLAKVLTTYSPASALDMGCGTGYLAMVMRRRGTPEVWALDHHFSAVACARSNFVKNGLADIYIEQSDLFGAIPQGVKFDLIVFNHPYYPVFGDVIFGLGSDGGGKIIERFVSQVAKYLLPDGMFLMPFSDLASSEHHPVPIAKNYGYYPREVFHHDDGANTHRIYEFKM